MPRRVIGVDAHKKSFTFVVVEDGVVLAGPSRRPATVEQVQSLVREFPGAEVVVEAVGPHEWMHDVWVAEGADVFVCRPPKQDKLGDKSDGKDAVLLARRRLSGELKRVFMPSPELRLLRSVVRERTFLVKRRTQLVNHIKHEQNRWNLSHFHWDKRSEELLERLPHLEANILLVREITAHVKRFDKTIKELAGSNEVVERLQSIPGFGPVVSLGFYTEVGNIERFATGQALVKFLGMDPVWRQSGDTLIDQHRISKEGRNHLRGLLVQAAWAHIRCTPDSPFTQKYHQLVKRGKPKQVAIVGVARRLAETAHRLWRQNQEFTVIRPALPVSSPT